MSKYWKDGGGQNYRKLTFQTCGSFHQSAHFIPTCLHPYPSCWWRGDFRWCTWFTWSSHKVGIHKQNKPPFPGLDLLAALEDLTLKKETPGTEQKWCQWRCWDIIVYKMKFIQQISYIFAYGLNPVLSNYPFLVSSKRQQGGKVQTPRLWLALCLDHLQVLSRLGQLSRNAFLASAKFPLQFPQKTESTRNSRRYDSLAIQ